jgi:hypothetical protein
VPEDGGNRLRNEHSWSRGESRAGRSARGGEAWWSSHGDPGVQTITGVSGFGANAPRVLQRAAEPIPDQLNSQLHLTLHLFDGSRRSSGCPVFPSPGLVRRATGARRLSAGTRHGELDGVAA